MNNEQIAFMKENRIPWALLEESERALFHYVIKPQDTLVFNGNEWHESTDRYYADSCVYKLKSDYQPPAEKVPEKLEINNPHYTNYSGIINEIIDYLHSVESRLEKGGI